MPIGSLEWATAKSAWCSPQAALHRAAWQRVVVQKKNCILVVEADDLVAPLSNGV
jgi:hypothetical protein